MDSLVNYENSSSSSDSEEENVQSDNKNEKSVRNKKDSAEAVPETQQNLLMSNVDNSSDEDIVGGVEDDEYNDACKYLNSKLPNPLAVERLPLPNLDKPVASTLGATGSKTTVCLTDYQRDEQVKLSALEKHVKITDIPTGRKINGVQVCWMYRRGQCRKGHRCPFAHDNDLFVDQTGSNHQTNNVRFGAGYFRNQHITADKPDDDNYMSNAKRKKRPGVNDHLRPPKKSMSMLDKQRATERPWTVQKDNS